jgi:hypothetical protein
MEELLLKILSYLKALRKIIVFENIYHVLLFDFEIAYVE